MLSGGNLCKKIIGYDANALYLWALGNDMPCGRLTTIEAYDGIVEDIVADKIFGFLECDIQTPDHLKDYFSEMNPIFKNTLIDCADESVIGHRMFKYNEARKQSRAKPARKLIDLLLYQASSHKAIDPFMDAISNARREGDVDKSKTMMAEMMKLVGNSDFGRSGMDMSKHKRSSMSRTTKLLRTRSNNLHSTGWRSLMILVRLR
ncbi:unnamed protein product [Phytophthora lilii]|uniref:DNA-directed DNA polymerase n=1 Tax=Phytophthora lilii TaxID=2077276 RepID=A0A9W6XGA1_9STRA|nr:unnamed protein product [Phytophthora lilii]